MCPFIIFFCQESVSTMKANWNDLSARVSVCRECGLCAGRKHTVLGEGCVSAPVMFVGEGPGEQEDNTGRPFVGKAGQLLDRMLGAIDLSREKNAYICNIVKCRPPNNRAPVEDEAAACLPYLREQFVLIQPKIIVCLGATAAKYLLDPNIRITRDRGVWHNKNGVDFIATFHPAALLRNPDQKYAAWDDMQAIRDKLRELE